MDNLKSYIPLLMLIRGRGMLQSHMEKINKEYGTNIVLKETSLRNLTKLDLHSGGKLDFIKNIADNAQKEWSIK